MECEDWGLLVDGVWHDRWYDTATSGGRFERDAARFRNWVTADGSPGPSGAGGFVAEPGRYHLYAAYFCPWAHRTLIFRRLKGLEEIVGVSVSHFLMRENGVSYEPGPGVVPDTVNGARFLYEIYRTAAPDYSGRVSVPVLWDKATGTIVSNESSEIIRMFNSAFDGVGAEPSDYYPPALRPQIDMLNERIYATVNNGVYRAGFATTQSAYEEAVIPLFATLDWLEERLASARYLCGDRLTEADIRLFTTLIRFDMVYYGHFKCNIRRIEDYPALAGYIRDVYQRQGIADTVRPDHIKGHYYGSHPTINPSGIVPVGPFLDFLRSAAAPSATARG